MNFKLTRRACRYARFGYRTWHRCKPWARPRSQTATRVTFHACHFRFRNGPAFSRYG